MREKSVFPAVFPGVIVMTFACALVSSRSQGTETGALRAHDFIHSVGVAAHYNCTGTLADHDRQILQYLKDARIWNIRTDWRSAGPGTSVIKHFGDAGIRFAFTIKAANSNDVQNPAQGVERQLNEIKGNDCVKYAKYITGTNEPDIAPEYQSTVGDGWPAAVKAWQTELWNRVKNDAAFSGVPVAGPSPGHLWQIEKRTQWQSVADWDNVCDIADYHPYWNGRPMEPQMATWQEQLAEIWPDKVAAKQIIATEMGYHYATGVDGHISEEGAAVYYLRAWLEMFRLGHETSYMYMLENLLVPDPDNREHNWGMFRKDGTPRPVYHALKNLNTIIDDPDGETFSPGSLDYTFSAQPSDLTQVLLMKNNRTFVLALWRSAVSVWDVTAKTNLTPSPQNVTVGFAALVSSIKVYTPNNSANPERTVNAQSVTVALGGKVVLLEIATSPTSTGFRPVLSRLARRSAYGGTERIYAINGSVIESNTARSMPGTAGLYVPSAGDQYITIGRR